MALITRVSRLFRADLHAVLDRIEEPEALLRQAVRDMEEDLAGDEQRSRLLQHEQGQINRRQGELDQSLVQLEQELDLCFDSGKEGLARALVKRKLETQRMQKSLCSKAEALQQALTLLQARIAEHRGRLDSMRQKVELLAEQSGTGETEFDTGMPETSVSEDDIEIAFLREQQKRRSS